jgi:hypothetical protein
MLYVTCCRKYAKFRRCEVVELKCAYLFDMRGIEIDMKEKRKFKKGIVKKRKAREWKIQYI